MTKQNTGSVIYVYEGCEENVFGQFYEELHNHLGDPNYIKQISMDMSKSYISRQRTYFSNVEVVFDKFHTKKAINESVDKGRKTEAVYNESLKKTKYIWLRNEENLNAEQKLCLSKFFEDVSTSTAKAYQLKTAFDQLWRVQKNAVEPMLYQLISMAKKSALKPILAFVKTVRNHFNGIVNSMKSHLNNALSEGLNSVFQLSEYWARVYRNDNNFISMIYLLGNEFKFYFH